MSAVSNELRVGIVGCGWQGGQFAEAVRRCQRVRLVACADPDEGAAGQVAAGAPDASTHESVEALLAEREVDAVIVTTPHHALAPAALAALRAGKHVLVEKPVALCEREAAALEDAAARAGVCLMAGYSFRFSMLRHVRALLASGAAGEIVAVRAAGGVAPMDDGWAARPETGGGPLMYVGSHLIDAALWLLGRQPGDVYATMSRRADTGADDTTALQLRCDGGALVSLLVTQSAPSFFYELDIYGRQGTIALRGRSFLQFEVEVLSMVLPAYAEPTVIRPEVQHDAIEMMLVPEVAGFAQAALSGRAPPIPAADARRVLRVIDAAVESARCGRAVALGAAGECARSVS